MQTIIGIVVIVVGLIAWVGQSLSFLMPTIAIKLGLCEPEDEMDQSFYIIETKAQGLSDMLLGWTLPLSGILMIFDHKLWPILALIGGGTYIYFSAVIMLSRIFLKKRDKKVGRQPSENSAYVFDSIWILSAITMIVLATKKLGF